MLLRTMSLLLVGWVACARGPDVQDHGEGARPEPPDLAPRVERVDPIFGVDVADPYRTLERPDEVQPWLSTQAARFAAYSEALPQRQVLQDRFQSLWRYDDETARVPCRLGEREIWRTRRADQDKWVIHLAEQPGAEGRVVLDPNTWDALDELAGFTPSPDCRYAVYGRARAGDEDPVLRVLDLDTGEELPDRMRGRKQRSVSWRHDNSAFTYMANPLEGELGPDAHHYWWRVWRHELGTPADQDELVLASEEDRNLFHNAWVSSDGRWQFLAQARFNANRLWIRDLSRPGAEPVPVVEELEGNVEPHVVDGRLLLLTDLDAPNWRVMVADPRRPGRAEWTELIPEGEDRIEGLTPADGRLYVRYSTDVRTRIEMFSLDGESLGEVSLPTIGSASVWGRWDLDDVRVSFQSFAHPRTVYRYDPASDDLTVLDASNVPVDPELLDEVRVHQAWLTSRDGTRLPMFVVHLEGADAGGPRPTLLTGYGGFDISMRPRFSTTALAWVEQGGVYAIPNLRGGGEFGQAWHQAGMRERKQNVFDDFLAAATWLVEEGWTTPSQLAISGRSNGGLLVSAAVTQRPDLFGAVLCEVPLTDMIRFHRFGLADIWTEEYGSADDEEMFPHLLAYSPYHAVEDGVDYPAILVVGSRNDARTSPVHALKFMAAVRHADRDRGTEEPILLDLRSDSGHGGGVGIDVRADQTSRALGFLMAEVGLEAEPVAPAPEAVSSDR